MAHLRHRVVIVVSEEHAQESECREKHRPKRCHVDRVAESSQHNLVAIDVAALAWLPAHPIHIRHASSHCSRDPTNAVSASTVHT